MTRFGKQGMQASDNQHCMPPSDEASRGEAIRGLYTELALHPASNFGWGKGIENARALGYSSAWLERLPAVIWESSAAVGNPFGLGPIHPGETVVDLGCGAGADVCVAALLVGAQGRVLGADVTLAMVEKARANAKLAGLANVEICAADIAGLPFADACAHVVISNGAINLSPRKACVLKEAFRVLMPGGRLYIADIVRDAEAQQVESKTGHSTESWANCVAGTLTPRCFLQMLTEAGFVKVTFIGTTGYRTSAETVGATFRASKPAESLGG